MKKNVAEVLDILEGFGYETSAFQTTPEEIQLAMKLRESQRLGSI